MRLKSFHILATALFFLFVFTNKEWIYRLKRTNIRSKNRIVFHLRGTAGLGSNLVNALNAIVIAHYVNLPIFIYTHRDWLYDHLNEYLSYRYIKNFVSNGDKQLCGKHLIFPVNFENFKVFAQKKNNSQIDFCRIHHWKNFQTLTKNFFNKLKRQNNDVNYSFKIKSNLTQDLFWDLKPKYDNLVKCFLSRKQIRDDFFVSIHIRRGDKITSGEMRNIPLNDFYSALLSLLKTKNKKQKATVFLFSDDASSLTKFINLHVKNDSGYNIQFLDIVNVYETVKDQPNCFDIYKPQVIDLNVVNNYGHNQRYFRQMRKKERVKQTRDLLLSIEIARYSDFFIGTFSSNIDRLIAILKRDMTLDSCISLDQKWRPG